MHSHLLLRGAFRLDMIALLTAFCMVSFHRVGMAATKASHNARRAIFKDRGRTRGERIVRTTILQNILGTCGSKGDELGCGV